jgi:iron-sulfur cluster assembly protein
MMESQSTYTIFISDKAAEQVKKRLVKRGTPNAYIRLGVQGAGCSGFAYALQFEDSPPRPKDFLFELLGVRIIVDAKSIVYLNGATLDWEQTLLQQGYKFVNPQEKSKCGCGNSFTV